MAKIRSLSEQTINQIAAGEVVENPASVVKELVENAIDAESQSIRVEIAGGGFHRIAVIDDGTGMDQEDLVLCLERHATSKIRSSEDLKTVNSMGFRGEALASIASVARVEVTSTPKGSGMPLGASVSMHGGVLKGVKEASRPHGTSVEVSSLFYNVPARKKFQKSASASRVEVQKIMTKLTLAYPHIEFKLLIDNEEVINSKGSAELKKTIGDVLGSPFLEDALQVEHQNQKCAIHGFIGAPNQARPNRLGQYLFINQRAVVCPAISYALYDGYGTRLMEKRHPTFVLHLTLPNEWVDVNVHPQKREVRLREEQLIKSFIRSSVLASFQGVEPKTSRPVFSETWNPPQFSDFEPPLKLSEPIQEEVQTFSFVTQVESFHTIGLHHSFLLVGGDDPHIQLPGHKEKDGGLFFVNLKRAHSAVCYDAFLNQKISQNELQGLNVPIKIDLMPSESSRLNLHLESMEKIGVGVRPFGENCFLIDAIDPRLDPNQVKPLLLELIGIFETSPDEKPTLIEDRERKKVAHLLCRYAKSQKKGWSLVEATALLGKLLKTSSPYVCPKGHPTIGYLEQSEIEKRFS